MTDIAILDYGMGNRRSVEKALEHVGARAVITRDNEQIRAAAGLVIPGVGAFPLAMGNLHELGVIEVIRTRAEEGTPILGICLGMQLLFERSEELEPTEGLGLIPGEVTWLRTGGLRVPHIGWNEVAFLRPCALTEALPEEGCPFYHVHSLTPRPSDPGDAVGTAEYGEHFVTIVQREQIFGVQFHPEKSSAHGLRMLLNFSRICSEAASGVAARA